MTPIYDAAHVSDAHLVKSLLEQAEIPAYIRGELLQGALGEVPVSGQMAVCVAAENAARARAIVEDWQASAPLLDETDLLDGDEIQAHAAPEPPRDGPGRRHVIGLAVGLLLAVALAWVALRPLA